MWTIKGFIQIPADLSPGFISVTEPARRALSTRKIYLWAPAATVASHFCWIMAFLKLLHLTLIRTLQCWVLNKEASSIIFWIFGMIRPGIEHRFPGQLPNILWCPIILHSSINCFPLPMEKLWNFHTKRIFTLSFLCFFFYLAKKKLSRTHQEYWYLLPILKTIQVRQTKPAGYFRRNKDKLKSDVLWTPIHGNVSVGQPANLYTHASRVDTECSRDDPPGAVDDWDNWLKRVTEILALCDLRMMMMMMMMMTKPTTIWFYLYGLR